MARYVITVEKAIVYIAQQEALLCRLQLEESVNCKSYKGLESSTIRHIDEFTGCWEHHNKEILSLLPNDVLQVSLHSVLTTSLVA